ncbi:hypothetical protein H9635_09240 [Solibacillus sp. A46]|uniref:Uncharacterized protein n=1 Tax=Solibacillus faecavium TaxID=2762221 RepID=A0ABR8XYC3_9BACL|nr:hypothetical protein [Solibacillus faecavium]MBD8036928.1 hypothetical protein [Solibacillus faecavium]
MTNSISSGATVLNIGDILATLIMLGVMALPFILVIFFYKSYKKNANRAAKRSSAEKQEILNLQKQIDELNERISKIENGNTIDTNQRR